MQIRYLEAMQAMAKTANSKGMSLSSVQCFCVTLCKQIPRLGLTQPLVIFLPAQNQTVQTQMAIADAVGEGAAKYQDSNEHGAHDFGMNALGMQSAINAGMVQHI